jgi:hypothetical protein
MRYWALRLGREAPPCILSRRRTGARGEPAGESNEPSRYISRTKSMVASRLTALTASHGRLQIGPGSPMTEKRKLAAILAADVVGFSRLTGSDEEGTLARLRTLWSDLTQLLNPRVRARTRLGRSTLRYDCKMVRKSHFSTKSPHYNPL